VAVAAVLGGIRHSDACTSSGCDKKAMGQWPWEAFLAAVLLHHPALKKVVSLVQTSVTLSKKLRRIRHGWEVLAKEGYFQLLEQVVAWIHLELVEGRLMDQRSRLDVAADLELAAGYSSQAFVGTDTRLSRHHIGLRNHQGLDDYGMFQVRYGS